MQPAISSFCDWNFPGSSKTVTRLQSNVISRRCRCNWICFPNCESCSLVVFQLPLFIVVVIIIIIIMIIIITIIIIITNTIIIIIILFSDSTALNYCTNWRGPYDEGINVSKPFLPAQRKKTWGFFSHNITRVGMPNFRGFWATSKIETKVRTYTVVARTLSISLSHLLVVLVWGEDSEITVSYKTVPETHQHHCLGGQIWDSVLLWFFHKLWAFIYFSVSVQEIPYTPELIV